MSEHRYALTVTAQGEVRDAEGNLVSTEPLEATVHVTEAELRALGITPTEGETP